MTTEMLYLFGEARGDKEQILSSELNKILQELLEDAFRTDKDFCVINVPTFRSIAGYDVVISAGFTKYVAEVVPQYAVNRRKFPSFYNIALSDYTTLLQQAIEDLAEFVILEVKEMARNGEQVQISLTFNAINITHNHETVEMYVADENDYYIDGYSIYPAIVDRVIKECDGVVLKR